ncbi:MAG: lipoyl(octanoyl) transferase LipB [Burkholderiaceae bacterium]
MAPVQIKPLRQIDYETCRREMQTFTEQRSVNTADQIWLVEHPAVFTLGLAGKSEHLLDPGPIPVIKTERGGQVTYHGPGQLVAYTLIDLRRRGLTVKTMVYRLEQALIEVLEQNGIRAERKTGAPGVYVTGHEPHSGSKIAALGLKVRRGCTFHGVALNVAMDLQPFTRINPCGYPGLTVTDMKSVLGQDASPVSVAGLSEALATSLVKSIS